MEATGTAQSFYRIIPHDRSRLDDFLSIEELGLPLIRELSPVQAHRWMGLSMVDSLPNAIAQQQRSRRLGNNIAEVSLLETNQWMAERTGRSHGHWTVWAEAELLLRSVVAIIPVDN